MRKIWLVVANSGEAKFFRTDEKSQFVEMHSLYHMESHLHDRDLVSDRPGRTYESFSTARSAYEHKASPHVKEKHIFADQILDYLAEKAKSGEVEKIYLAAPDAFLGILRSQMPEPLHKLVIQEINRDLTKIPLREIRETHLPLVL